MQEVLLAVIEELKRLRREGVESIYLADNTVDNFLLAMRADAGGELEAQLDMPEGHGEVKLKPGEIAVQGLVETGNLPPPPVLQIPAGTKVEKLQWLKERVLACPECNKHVKPGKKVVFGVGDPNARIFFCGEAPGADEEEQGEPFVGKAGDTLNGMIKGMGLSRDQVYIGNIMNWRPEMPTPYGNRPPTREEMAFCLPYLRAQIEIVRPEVIVALGNTATEGLLGPDKKRTMKSIRGKWFEFDGIPLIPTYHPSYLLRNSTNRSKREVWEDMLAVMEHLALPISEKQRNYFL
ncbi:MAG: uracil-DNA glycosylase [Verrucomicrobia bacterium]|nr:uracil-DNA glycosylase [Verrucomicrobiota bacterium]